MSLLDYKNGWFSAKNYFFIFPQGASFFKNYIVPIHAEKILRIFASKFALKFGNGFQIPLDMLKINFFAQ
jgi:hypothetical protein